MGDQTDKIIIGVSVGVAFGVLISACVLISIRFYRKRACIQTRSRNHNQPSLPIHVNENDASNQSSASLTYSEPSHGLQQTSRSSYWGLQQHRNKSLYSSLSGIPKYLYKDVQKATENFTTTLGQGSFGSVYKATMPTGEVVAVKVLANNTRQGEREFQTEVLLLSRLHHRNLVNLVGYCIDKGQLMLIYEFMSNGSLESLLYGGSSAQNLSWEERLQIAHDVSHGIEYLHEGANPPVVHRDLKSANILLDKSLRAKVADFGLSKEDIFDGRISGLKGTYGYMDPDYMSTNKFTKKSDIYSFGIILFELLTAINPQQGLLDYINLAAIGGDEKPNWEEIIHKDLIGKSNIEEVGRLADIAYRCLNKNPRRRPTIVDVSLAISRIRQRRLDRQDTVATILGDASVVLDRIESQQVELNNLTRMKQNESLKH